MIVQLRSATIIDTDTESMTASVESNRCVTKKVPKSTNGHRTNKLSIRRYPPENPSKGTLNLHRKEISDTGSDPGVSPQIVPKSFRGADDAADDAVDDTAKNDDAANDDGHACAYYDECVNYADTCEAADDDPPKTFSNVNSTKTRTAYKCTLDPTARVTDIPSSLAYTTMNTAVSTRGTMSIGTSLPT